MARHYDILIVGAGHGGAQTAIALRQNGFAGSIAIIGEEREPPYERPPLSKEYLAGDKTFERLHLRPEAFWRERAIDLVLGARVVFLDAASKQVATEDGERFGYGALVWAAGGRPRRLDCEGGDLAGVHSVRTRADVDQLLAELSHASRVAVIGGGYIGLEAAAVLRKFGKSVTLIEAQDRLLARVAGPTLSRFYLDEHRAHGVDVRLASTVARLVGAAGRVAGVVLGTGETIEADLVIVGIGVVPAVEVPREAGAQGANGVLVDGRCRTSLPDVFAVGDCAAQRSRYASDEVVRIESVPNANDQALTVARELTGQGRDHDALPWFWSNQFDLRLQTVGLSGCFDAEVVRGEPKNRSFSIVYLRQGKIIALDRVNAAKDFARGKSLVANGVVAEPDLLADMSRPLGDHVAL
jgi:3-phenylpropionate/trans-cinnamate dioxygenase ferredoxin reductase subunit